MTTLRKQVGTAVLGLCSVLWIGCGGELETVASESLPELRVATLGGEEVALQTLAADKPLLLWFWAPW